MDKAGPDHNAKIAKAKQFIKKFQKLKKEEINALLLSEVGEPLILFFQDYCAHLVKTAPERVQEFLPTVMTLGYLISSAEQDK